MSGPTKLVSDASPKTVTVTQPELVVINLSEDCMVTKSVDNVGSKKVVCKQPHLKKKSSGTKSQARTESPAGAKSHEKSEMKMACCTCLNCCIDSTDDCTLLLGVVCCCCLLHNE